MSFSLFKPKELAPQSHTEFREALEGLTKEVRELSERQAGTAEIVRRLVKGEAPKITVQRPECKRCGKELTVQQLKNKCRFCLISCAKSTGRKPAPATKHKKHFDKKPFKCLGCGAEFSATPYGQYGYARCPKCELNNRLDRKPIYKPVVKIFNKLCVQCGKAFQTKREISLCCSQPCGQKYAAALRMKHVQERKAVEKAAEITKLQSKLKELEGS